MMLTEIKFKPKEGFTSLTIKLCCSLRKKFMLFMHFLGIGLSAETVKKYSVKM